VDTTALHKLQAEFHEAQEAETAATLKLKQFTAAEQDDPDRFRSLLADVVTARELTAKLYDQWKRAVDKLSYGTPTPLPPSA
jgi:hypothetical protein